MTGVCISRTSGQFIATDNQSKCVYHYTMVGDKYRFNMCAKYGESKLSEPLDVTQLADGRVAVTDGKAGHSVKVRDAALLAGVM